MTRQSKNSKKTLTLDADESGREELGTTPTDVEGISAVPTPTATPAPVPAPASAVVYRPSDKPTEAQKERFKDTWKFQPLVDELVTDASKPKEQRAKDYFTKYFNVTVPTFTPRTLLLFEKWSGLVNNNSRNGQMKGLIGLLLGRWSGHRGKGISMGNNTKTKDENLRADLLELLEKWYPSEDFGDYRIEAGNGTNEDADEIAIVQPGETAAIRRASEPQRVRPSQQPIVSTSTRHSTPEASKPRDGAVAPQNPEERTVLERTILENWTDHAATVPDHLPDFIGPAGLHWTDWPFDILVAIMALSSVTRTRESEVIAAKLQELAPTARSYSHPRSLTVLNTARDYFNNGKGVQMHPKQDKVLASAHPLSGGKKRAGREAPSGQRPQKQPHTGEPNHAPARAESSLAGARPLQNIVGRLSTSSHYPYQPQDTNNLKAPHGLSNAGKIHYRDLSFEIMEKDSQRCEAERLIDRAVSQRSLACLNDGNCAFAALEAEVGARRAEVERLRREIVGLQVRRWKIRGLGSEDAARE